MALDSVVNLCARPDVSRERVAFCAWGGPDKRGVEALGTWPSLGDLASECPHSGRHPWERSDGGLPGLLCRTVADRVLWSWRQQQEVGSDWERRDRGSSESARAVRSDATARSDWCGYPHEKRAHALTSSDVIEASVWFSRRLRGSAAGVCEPPPSGPVGIRPLVGPQNWKRWKIAISNTWKHNAHINVLELYAETLAMSWVLRKGSPCTPRRFVLLQDSQVAVFAGTKGRSSSLPLLRALRRTAALLLGGNLYVDRLWLPSKANPADGPSRKRAVGVF